MRYNTTEDFLRDRWLVTLRRARILQKFPGEEVISDLLVRYSEPHRYYHTQEHLRACFEVLDAFFPREDYHGMTWGLEMALWFHDAVYDSTAKDNEEKSAELAKSALVSMGATPAFQQSVADLILATKHTAPARSIEEMLLLDVDTHVLGASEETYQQYEDNIRREYSWVPMDIYREKRTEILQMFLDRPFIFMTGAMHDAYDAQARKNLTRAIKALT